ncbi:MAG: hypothetical protein HRT47_01930 [Candidatus Caenarcaniphilales bacterium]|nr:hypothetical protein [Candidatus Caenarcaniphilales bacterium]
MSNLINKLNHYSDVFDRYSQFLNELIEREKIDKKGENPHSPEKRYLHLPL